MIRTKFHKELVANLSSFQVKLKHTFTIVSFWVWIGFHLWYFLVPFLRAFCFSLWSTLVLFGPNLYPFYCQFGLFDVVFVVLFDTIFVSGENQEHFYARVTHLHHQNQKIYQIGDLSPVPNLTVLYLYDNKLSKIEHLDSVPHLQMLYLQRCKISKIENLENLKRLKKLYLSNNRIGVIENLEELDNLQGKNLFG